MRLTEERQWNSAVGRESGSTWFLPVSTWSYPFLPISTDFYLSFLPVSTFFNLFLPISSHLLRTGAVQDLVIVSERQLVKGISRIVAVTGRDATRVGDIITPVLVCVW